MEVFDPTTEAEGRTIDFVARPDTLRNLRLGLVENTKYNSDRLLLKIAAILEQEHGAQSHLLRRKHNSSVPAHDEILEEIVAECDVVVAGVGD